MTTETTSNLTHNNDAENISSLQSQAQVSVESAARAASSTPFITITHGYDNAGSTVGDFTSGATIDDTTPALFGQTSPNGTVRVYVDNVLKGYATADASGNWTITLSGLSNGAHIIRAELLNGFSKVATSENFIINIGVSAPIITAVLDDAGEIKGHLDQHDWTDDRRPELMGAAEPGHLVKIYDGATLLGTTVANASGIWRFTPETDLGLGTHSLVAQAEDANGIVSGLSSPWAITVVSPATISHGTDEAGAIVGDFTSGATVDETRPMLHGQASPNALVKIYVDNVWMGDVLADVSGNWSYRLSELSNGTHAIRAELMNGSTLVSMSEDFVIHVAVASVQAPVITAVLDDVGSVTGNLEQNSSTDDTRPELMGTAQAGHLVKIYDGATLLGSTVADASGIWRFTPESGLNQGKHTFMAEALDAIGNISSKSDAWTITVSTSPVSITHGYDGAGAFGGNFASGATVDDNTPTLYGQATPNGSVWIYIDNVLKGSTKADASGNWSHTVGPLSNGQYTFSVRLMNGWAQVAKSEEFVINVAFASVQAPVITAVLDDVGMVTGHLEQNGSTDDRRPELMGTAEAGQLVRIYDGTTLLGTTVADASGVWRYTLESDLSHGKHSLAAEALDPVGNISGKSNSWAITVGTNTSAVSITHGHDNAGNTIGNFDNGATVDDTAPTIHGQATPNGSLWIYVDNVTAALIKADSLGNWSYTLKGLSDGLHSVSAALTDGWCIVAISADFIINVDTSPKHMSVEIEHYTNDAEISGMAAASSVELPTSSPEESANLSGASSRTLKLSVGDVLEQGGPDLFHTIVDAPMPAQGSDVAGLDDVLSDSLGPIDWLNAPNASVDDAAFANYQHSFLETQSLAQQEMIVSLV